MPKGWEAGDLDWVDLDWKPAGDHVFVWREDQFEPDFNLRIWMVGGFWHFTLNGEPVSIRQLLPGGIDYYSYMLREGDEVLLRVDEWMCMLPILPTLGCTIGSEEELCGEGDEDWYSVRMNGDVLELCASGRSYPLARGAARHPDTQSGDSESTWDYLYLSDLVEALGGTYHYDATNERVDLTLPEH